MPVAAPLAAATVLASSAFPPASVAVTRETAPGARAAARIEGVVDIPAPPAIVWALMIDCDRAPTYVPGLDACTVREIEATAPSEAGAAVLADHRLHQVRWLWPLPRAQVAFRSEYDPETQIRFARTGGDAPLLDGVWRLEPLDEGAATRLSYSARIGVAAPLPGPIFRNRVAADARAILEAVRTEAIRDAARD